MHECIKQQLLFTLCCLVLPTLGNKITEGEANTIIIIFIIITIIIIVTVTTYHRASTKLHPWLRFSQQFFRMCVLLTLFYNEENKTSPG